MGLAERRREQEQKEPSTEVCFFTHQPAVTVFLRNCETSCNLAGAQALVSRSGEERSLPNGGGPSNSSVSSGLGAQSDPVVTLFQETEQR